MVRGDFLQPAGSGGPGGLPPFRVTVPSVDVDWTGFEAAGDETDEETRFVIVPLNTNKVDDTRHVLLWDPYDDDERNARPTFAHGRRVNPDITLDWDAKGTFLLVDSKGAPHSQTIEASGGEFKSKSMVGALKYTLAPLPTNPVPKLSFRIHAGGQETPDGKALDNIRGRAVLVDLDVEADGNPGITDDDEPLEENPGAYACLCTNNLTPIKLKVAPAGLPGRVTLSANVDETRIRVWQNSNRTGAVPLPRTWPAGAAIPATLYVEGVTNSASARDIALTLTYDENQPGQNNPLFKCEDKVRLTVVKVDIKFANPDGTGWADLEEKRVILSDENTCIKLKMTPQLPDLQTIFNALGTALKITTSGTAPNGHDYSLTYQNTTLIQGSGYSEMRVSLTRNQLRTLGVLPSQEADSVTEKAWLDHGSSSSSDPSNLTDGNAFESGLPDDTRGKSTNYGNLESTPPNSPVDKTFFVAAGREIITAEYGGAVSHKRQLMNQADHFYYSGHGSHANATLQGGFAPGDVTGYWNKDLDYAIIAGCAVLDIKDYRARSFSISTRLKWYNAGGNWSPGAQWESSGPRYLLGYNWTAPLDNQGSAGIISNFISALDGGASVVDAWKQANDLGIGRNACVIDCSTTPHVYWYWDETSGAPVWTSVIKSGGSW